MRHHINKARILVVFQPLYITSINAEPRRRSIDTAGHIKQLATEIGFKNIAVVGNKIRGPQDEAFLRKHLAGFEFIGFRPYDDALIEADLGGLSPFDVESSAKTAVQSMIAKL